ncbi:MAG: hypothetical protein FJZ00_06730 [Candidatus Sericytochromatia bacterium]|uniref:Orc1-like AAA ATPase domain-containing protein n=1 Tax=Candidatus Tanganyikabacteria bacterium TaxID=2961651 RepID=A0A937X620_9BACT|nr:hypothetical protein [Candidatus Tanganyikabacteria bacterium]
MLSLSLDDRYPVMALAPARQRQKTLECVGGWLRREAERHPLVVVWEDVHWADPTTVELLAMLVNSPAPHTLTVLTYRPEFHPPWPDESGSARLQLGRLGRTLVQSMLDGILGGKPLPTEVVEQIAAKTDGVPLFVEEVTKLLIESGTVRERDDRYELVGPLGALAVPATLQDSLMARLDRLPAARDLAQLGATVGREFGYELIRAVTDVDDEQLRSALDQLVCAEMLCQSGLPPRSTYMFKHALIQDVAYQSLLKSKRRQFHDRIARVLEDRFPGTVETRPELLAHHFTGAGIPDRAGPYWRVAGERAVQRSAHLEAIGHLTRGLEQTALLPRHRRPGARGVRAADSARRAAGHDTRLRRLRGRACLHASAGTVRANRRLWRRWHVHGILRPVPPPPAARRIRAGTRSGR